MNWSGLSANDHTKAKCLMLTELLETIHVNGVSIESEYFKSLNERKELFLGEL